MQVPGAVLVGRSSVVLFALYVVLGTTLASGQTVILRHAPPGSTLELVLDAQQAGTAQADAGGTATITTKTVDGAIDVNVWMEICDVNRVILVRPGATPIPAGNCRRTQFAGLFRVQRITSIVVDATNTASLLIRQGPAYDSWLTDPRPQVAKAVPAEEKETGTAQASAAAPAKPLPPLTGLTLFGLAGLGKPLDFESQACGTLDCTRTAPIQLGAGGGWWFNDFFGVEARYGYLGKVTVDGPTGNDFQFSTTREGGFLAVTGRAGVRFGRFRPFGRAGMSFDRATVTTVQTIGESSQTIQMRARGWAPVFGAGLEIWLTPRFGLYFDAQRLGLKGKDERDTGIEANDTLLTAQAGVTLRFK